MAASPIANPYLNILTGKCESEAVAGDLPVGACASNDRRQGSQMGTPARRYRTSQNSRPTSSAAPIRRQ
jgi:hypothetical protein